MKNIFLFLVFSFYSTLLFSQRKSQNLYVAFNTLDKNEKNCLQMLYRAMENNPKTEEVKNNKVYYATVEQDNKRDIDIITIKMSDNSIFVFGFKDILIVENGEFKPSGQILAGYYNLKYGEIDKKSISFYYIDKKRVYPKNNIFTEQIWFNKICFELEQNQKYTQILIAGQKIIPFDFDLEFNTPKTF